MTSMSGMPGEDAIAEADQREALGSGATAIVTGASSGIGAATARALAAGGTTVALVARRADRLEQVLADCRLGAPRSRAWVADLADPELAADLAVRVWDELGPLDVIVHNAGIPLRRPVDRLTMAEVTRVMTVNYFSPVAMTLALLPRLLERRSGTIVNVSSLGGRLGIAGGPVRYRCLGPPRLAWRRRHRDLGPAR